MKTGLLKSLPVTLILAGCSTSDDQLAKQLDRVLEENPQILTRAIEKNPAQFVESMSKAVEASREQMAKAREEAEKQQLEASFAKPYEPLMRKNELRWGPKTAPITIVEYTDFECPYCSKGRATMHKLRERYGDKLQLITKHFPLNFHPHAKLAAQYFEAIRLQGPGKAKKFHALVFSNQAKLKQGAVYLQKVAGRLGLDLKKLNRDLYSQQVLDRIDQDMREAKKFGFHGTPGFLVNGIPVRGAYPEAHFISLIDELKRRRLVDL